MARSIPKNPTRFLSILHNFTTFLSDVFVDGNLRDLSLPIPLRQGFYSSDAARSVFVSGAVCFYFQRRPV